MTASVAPGYLSNAEAATLLSSRGVSRNVLPTFAVDYLANRFRIDAKRTGELRDNAPPAIRCLVIQSDLLDQLFSQRRHTVKLPTATRVLSPLIPRCGGRQIQMTKCQALNHAANNRLRDTIVISESLIGNAARSVPTVDFLRICIGKFGIVILFSAITRSVQNFILSVFLGSSPAKVLQAIITSIAIQMPALHAWRLWADKSRKNQQMDFLRPAAKAHHCIPVVSSSLPKYFSVGDTGKRSSVSDAGYNSSQRFDPTTIRDTVTPNVVWDITPAFQLPTRMDLDGFLQRDAQLIDRHGETSSAIRTTPDYFSALFHRGKYQMRAACT